MRQRTRSVSKEESIRRRREMPHQHKDSDTKSFNRGRKNPIYYACNGTRIKTEIATLRCTNLSRGVRRLNRDTSSCPDPVL